MTDQERARHYREHGYTYQDIATILGCSDTWAQALCDDSYRERLNANAARFIRSGKCATCGGTMTRNKHGEFTNGKAYVNCQQCQIAKQKAESFARNIVGETCRCPICKTHKQFTAFPQGALRRYLNRERRKPPKCTACDTKARTEYRRRHRVPCIECGKPRTGDGRRIHERGIDTGLCRACYQGRTEAVA